MNTDALRLLAENAAAWAKAYVRISEELIKQGVPEEIARSEARLAASMAAMTPPGQTPPEPWER